jgi:hypothetical protein
LVGIVPGWEVRAQPKTTYPVPEAVPPWAGESIVPKGFVAVAFVQEVVREPVNIL